MSVELSAKWIALRLQGNTSGAVRLNMKVLNYTLLLIVTRPLFVSWMTLAVERALDAIPAFLACREGRTSCISKLCCVDTERRIISCV